MEREQDVSPFIMAAHAPATESASFPALSENVQNVVCKL